MREGDSAEAARERTETTVLPLPELTEVSFSGAGRALSVLTDEELFRGHGVRIAFTNRLGGTSAGPYAELNLSTGVGDDPAAVMENRRLLLECLGAGRLERDLIVPRQVHGSLVVQVGDIEATRDVVQEGADGVICPKADVPVLLCFADCVPVVCVAPNGFFSVAHAGWRGALAGIAGASLAKLSTVAGCEPSACNCYIGPHIGECCYEVGPEVIGPFVERYGASCRSARGNLDLSAAVAASLARAGAVPGRVCDCGICTADHTETYYSYRAEGGTTGRHAALAFREEQGTWD